MKKSIWIVLPIVIIAVVLVAVFVGQRNNLSEQVAQLQAERTDLSRQLSEADIAAKTAQELAENSRIAMEEKVQEAESKIQEAETKIQEAEDRAQEAQSKVLAAEGRAEAAEGKAQEAVEALSIATTERDALQANANTAAEQLTVGIKQVQDALGVLGVSQDEDAIAAELEETKAALAAAANELAALKAESEAQADQAAAELQQVQDALALVTSERDQLQAAVEAAAAQALEMENLQNLLSEVTAERDALSVAKTAVSILDTAGNAVMTFENISDLKLNELSLQPGQYSIRIQLLNAEGNEIGCYDLPYVAAAAE